MYKLERLTSTFIEYLVTMSFNKFNIHSGARGDRWTFLTNELTSTSIGITFGATALLKSKLVPSAGDAANLLI